MPGTGSAGAGHSDCGVRQFLDIGTGLLSGLPHEVAAGRRPDARVV